MPETPTIHAAGFVIAHPSSNGWEYLLLRNASHGTWGPPKGHREDGEDNLICAERELKEETGITDFQIIDGFAESSTYSPANERDGGSRKTVTYFLATVSQKAMTTSSEHDNVKWATLKESQDILQFEELRDLIRNAEERL